MLDHVFLTVVDTDRSIAFYERVLPILGITNRLDYDGKDGLAGHPDLKGFGAKGRMSVWLRQGAAAPGAVHIGFVADSEEMVNAAHAEALAAGAEEIHPPGPQLHYDPRGGHQGSPCWSRPRGTGGEPALCAGSGSNHSGTSRTSGTITAVKPTWSAQLLSAHIGQWLARSNDSRRWCRIESRYTVPLIRAYSSR